jgi:nucleotide-binding universal stress UspA family protein
MPKIIACIDGSIYAASVCDHAAWAAQRLSAPVEVVHALGRRDTASVPFDLSGSLEFGEREALLKQLAELDAQKAKVSHLRGRHLVADAVSRIRAAGVENASEMLRHGDVADTVRDLGGETRLLVIGKRGEAADFAKGHLGSNMERVIRSTKKPVLVASRAFAPIERFLVAFDGGRSSGQVIEQLVASPLLSDLPCHLFMAGDGSGEAGNRLRAAEGALKSAGYAVTVGIEDGEPETVIAAKVRRAGIGLVVMGAYGHSRIRNLIVGSTTTALIESCTVPVLIIR